jgi:hypothetical protein
MRLAEVFATPSSQRRGHCYRLDLMTHGN